ncbi:uncharacterized protein LOC124365869 isoform X2 [Homalodisca vitripennis]|uniref:uncharacterized protein LOC124365869 isoform X2 n=1 Tax=Homalodisca vitripennis TaxID=197043 RepID=UPI001EEAD49A|nr:uncharacterized protein LOC124365869 isoform X2 [Homalodisca vitripennis]
MAQFEFVDAIQQKYLKEEVDLEDKLKAVREKYSSAGDKEGFKKGNNKIESQSKRAARRNKALLKDLEVAAGRLRVQSCYSPTEAHLEKAKQRYEQTLAELRRSSETCSSEHN